MRGRGNRGSPPAATLSSSPGGQRRVITIELLGRGVHASPHDGCNVLGYASVPAGDRWPSCPRTWPAITEVCVRAALTWVGQPDEPWLQVDLDAARNWPAEASRPANRRHTPRAERRQRRWAWHAARAQPTHGKTEPATTHLFWSVNGIRNS